MAEKRVNLNTATVEELRELRGVGPVLAQRIVAHRDSVGPYQKSQDLIAVTGIGQNKYRALADQLAVEPHADRDAGGEDAPAELAPEDGSDSRGLPDVGGSDFEAELPPPEELDGQPMPKDEKSAEGGLPHEGHAVKEEDGKPPLKRDEVSKDESGEEPADGDVLPRPDLPDQSEQAEAEGGAEEDGVEDDFDGGREKELPLASAQSTSGMTSAAPRRRGGSWVVTALLGGLLGMIFSLIVFAGINGSLDVAHSRPVLEIESDIRGLTSDLGSLDADVAELRLRLEGLEGLTDRMEEAESAVGDLSQRTTDLTARARELEQDINTVSQELEMVWEEVLGLQSQAEQARTFFSRLQTLLQDIFGEGEGESMPALPPTPTPGGE